jgi:unspecific peroxygenase
MKPAFFSLVAWASAVSALPDASAILQRATYPYAGSVNGSPATKPGGYVVPAVGDTAHAFKAPGAGDVRGPCPGMNLLANHGFIARNGITNYNEIVSALINVFNLGWDHATVLTTLGVASCGDIVTGKLSIGPDMTGSTSLLGLGLTGPEAGLNGHNVSQLETRNAEHH